MKEAGLPRRRKWSWKERRMSRHDLRERCDGEEEKKKEWLERHTIVNVTLI